MARLDIRQDVGVEGLTRSPPLSQEPTVSSEVANERLREALSLCAETLEMIDEAGVQYPDMGYWLVNARDSVERIELALRGEKRGCSCNGEGVEYWGDGIWGACLYCHGVDAPVSDAQQALIDARSDFSRGG